MDRFQEEILDAIRECYPGRQLTEMLGVHRSTISEWRKQPENIPNRVLDHMIHILKANSISHNLIRASTDVQDKPDTATVTRINKSMEQSVKKRIEKRALEIAAKEKAEADIRAKEKQDERDRIAKIPPRKNILDSFDTYQSNLEDAGFSAEDIEAAIEREKTQIQKKVIK